MSKHIIFIQAQGRSGIIETEMPESATFVELRKAIEAAGVALDENAHIFIDEAEEPVQAEHGKLVSGLKHGTRVHVSHSKRIKTTVHFLNKTAEREFAPGIRVRAVKAWAVHTFEVNPKDAAEHVLQLCRSNKRPAADTPLHELIEGHSCALCFDLVPEKRIEG
ncbi:hypothetical protein [Hoeflea poritis]|uniref:Uncharacterized protein n=1 Tax=Hoeflea poritis TaxID=2993659 RepID=A0ABT4VXM3_9HYPH|nr:hypothetical protein [Hoeflea poritis]MDA4848782.1 hypothetical protein [Hoeflea poritis]